MKSGIYTITSPSGKVYVGSAANFRTRWNTHVHALRNGAHHSEALQAAYDKYGEAELVFRPVIICAPQDTLFYEQRLIDSYPREQIYNTSYFATSRRGVRHKPATIAKMRISQTGRKATPETSAKLSRAKFNVAKSSNTSGYCGVSLQRGRTWRASVWLDGKRRHIPGKFETAAAAHAAREAYIAAYKTMIESAEQ